jgi:hypothetical protein
MYTCSKCGKGVLVNDLPEPIRACNCTQEVIVDGVTIVKPAAITMDLEGHAYGRSQFSN